MNALYPAIAALLVFAFGYRFFAKWLALDVFRLDEKYSTPAETRADGRDYVPTPRSLLAGHHLAAVTGAAAFAAPVVAAGWGWVPAFLWITAGSAVAAGTYGLGALWLSARHPASLEQTAARLIGPWARVALLVLIPVALVIVIAAAAGLAASLLAAYPGAALPLAALALLGVALGSYLHGRAERALAPACAAALLLALASVWLLGKIPLAFDGALAISVGGRIWFSIDAVAVWCVLLLVYAFHAGRAPVWRLMRPRGFLTALLLVLLLAAFYIALAVDRPVLHAPEFHAPGGNTGAVPWIFLAIGAGAIAGWQLFIVHGVSARELRRETDARYVGYGAGLVQGLAALSALLLAATAFATREAWTAAYTAVPAPADFPRALVFYVDAYTRHAAVLGIDAAYARHLAATVIAGLAVAVLEAAVRSLKHFLLEVAPPGGAPPSRRDGERARLWFVVIAAGALALHDGRGLGGVAAWPTLAAASLWVAALGFALMAFALRARGQPALPLAALAAAAGTIAGVCSAAQLWQAWRADAWTAFAAGIALLLLVFAVLRDVVAAVRRAAPAADAGASSGA